MLTEVETMGNDLNIIRAALSNLSVKYYDRVRRAKQRFPDFPDKYVLDTALNNILLELDSEIYKLDYARKRTERKFTRAPCYCGASDSFSDYFIKEWCDKHRCQVCKRPR